MTLYSTNESKEITKKCEELSTKIRDRIRLITNNLNNYYEKYMKIKFNSDDHLPLNKPLDLLRNTTIVVRAVFYEGNKYYAKVVLD